MSVFVWTRSVEDWSGDQSLLRTVATNPAIELLHAPCIATHPLPARPAREQYDHLVFTSRTAVARAREDDKLRELLTRAVAIHTHGAATAEALRELVAPSLVHMRDDARTAEELAAILLTCIDPSSHTGWPTAAKPAFDLAFALRAGGRKAEAIVCYETLTEARVAPAVAAEIEAATQGVVCFASPSAVTAFRARFPLVSLQAVVIGPTTAAAAITAGFKAPTTSLRNELKALIEAAEAVLAAAGSYTGGSR